MTSSFTSHFPISSLARRTPIMGAEDHVIFDIGSYYIKCGFSGESRPRHIYSVGDDGNEDLYDLNMGITTDMGVLDDRTSIIFRDLYYRYLLTDPKQRKVLICESPLLPIPVKKIIAKILFEEMQVPSVSFAPTHLLALLTTGQTTGLVIDCGNLETTVLPIFSSRPLSPFVRSTPIAGKALTIRLHSLLLAHARLVPPSHLQRTLAPRLPIPEDLLTRDLVEEIKTRLLFVSPVMIPPEDDGAEDDEDLVEKFQSASSATEVMYPIRLNGSGESSEGEIGYIVVPGWIRERAAECLFEGDEDEASIPCCILDCLLKLPVDLRRPMISSLLLIGGTPHLPNFQHRLHQELQRILLSPSRPIERRYKPLSGLVESVSFLEERLSARNREGPGRVFMPNIRGWVGGSLLASVKSLGPEIVREKFDGAVPDLFSSAELGKPTPSERTERTAERSSVGLGSSLRTRAGISV
ncbi:uncharacterized protein VTP21DRAFT_1885 [Calcarisporiella thermophila]|uniref:uncharacterized protein n=1 Tax=Calcarisporiella thermophila TaxID=911321 RepID=UPI0037445D69